MSSIANNSAEEFYNLACSFCSYVETTTITTSNIGEVITYLMELYIKALKLPDVDPDNVDYKRDLPTNKPLHIKFDCKTDYWHFFDPFVPDDIYDSELVKSALWNDLNEIYEDLKLAIVMYEEGYINDAIWEWKFRLNAHWGDHLVSTLAPLHYLRTGTGYSCSKNHS